jgi:hypothetical protein
MRRASTCLAVVGLALLALSGTASAAPTVTFKAQAVPIPGFPHTGNILGAGAAVEAEFHISGTEYGGYSPPLIGVNVYLPTGAKIHSAGFPTCPTATILTEKEPTKCPKGSKAGPVGTATGFVVFGSERVPETVSLESFWAQGGLNVFVDGHTPASIEVTSTGKYTKLGGGGGYGPELVTTVPLIETVPGAPDGSTSSIKLKVGAAMKKGKKTIYYGTMPTKCPKGGFPVKAELKFAALGGLTEQTVTQLYKAPCPRK